MGYRATITSHINNTPLLLLHWGYRLIHGAVTEMGVGPGLLAGEGEMCSSKSPRIIPPGSNSLEKNSIASNESSLMPHGWGTLALTPSCWIWHFASSFKKKKGSLITIHVMLLLFSFCSLIRNSSDNTWDILCVCCFFFPSCSVIWLKNMAWPS